MGEAPGPSNDRANNVRNGHVARKEMSAGAGVLDGALLRPLRRGAGFARSLARTIAGLSGWRHALVSMGAGALGILGLAPFHFLPALALSFVLLLWLMDGCAERNPAHAARRGFWTGWFFSFGFFFVGLQWVSNALTVDAETFAWLIPFTATLLPAGLALFAALALGAAGRFWRLTPDRVFWLAGAWVLAEWLRGHIFTGFPWNLIGLAWAGHLEVAQSAAIIGTYGLSFLTVAGFASLALLASDRAQAWRLPTALLAVFALLWIGGAYRLASNDKGVVEGVTVRIVQPGTRQAERRDRALAPELWRRLTDLTEGAAAAGVTHVIWPEAAPPYLLEREPILLQQLDEMLSPGMTLMTGMVRAEERGDGDFAYFNGFGVFDDQGAVQATYDKHHLVPFGEYLPFKSLLSAIGLKKVADGVGTLTPGIGPSSLPAGGNAPAMAPVICYEIIFPGEVTDAGNRPGWIVNVTDDDWFGDSIGPRQHLSIVRMRAIEEAMPVARSANSGISAMIDRFGRVEASIGLHQTGYVDVPLPRAGERTLYALWGDISLLMIGFASVLLGGRFRQYL